jgi:uncharacterized protein YneF (UPF0154 family)
MTTLLNILIVFLTIFFIILAVGIIGAAFFAFKIIRDAYPNILSKAKKEIKND